MAIDSTMFDENCSLIANAVVFEEFVEVDQYVSGSGEGVEASRASAITVTFGLDDP